MKMVQSARFLICIFSLLFLQNEIISVQILSKSKLEKCEKSTDSNDKLNCTTKIVIDMAVPSGSVSKLHFYGDYIAVIFFLNLMFNFVQSGGEASIVAEIVEVEENSTNKMQTLRIPPVITVKKSAAYAVYELTYIRVCSLMKKKNCTL